MKRKADRPLGNGKEGQEPATKADVAAVKSELKADVAAVKADVNALRSDLTAKMDAMKSALEFKMEYSIKDANEKMIEHMDKKFSEYVNHVDDVFGEIKTSREEQASLAHHSQDHTDRIDNHEKRIGKLETKVGGRAG